MVLTNEHGNHIRIDPLLGGVGFFYAAMLMVAHSSGIFASLFEAAEMVSVLRWAVLGICICALFWLISQASQHKLYDHEAGIGERVTITIGGGVLFAAGGAVLCFVPIAAGGGSISGLLLGTGFTLQALAWAALYAVRSPQAILFHTAIAMLITAICFTCTLVVPWTASVGAAFVVFLVFVVLETLLLVAGVRVLHTENNPNAVNIHLKNAMLDIWHVLWKPLAGAALTAFIVGLTWNPMPSGQVEERAAQWVLQYLFGPLLASGIVMAALRRSPKEFTLYTINDILLPGAIILLMVVPFFSIENALLSAFVSILSSMSFSIVVLVLWSALAAAIFTTDLAARVMVPMVFSLVGLVLAFGSSLIWVVGKNGQTLCLAITVVYLIVLVVSSAASSQRREQREIEHTAATRYLEGRTQQFAQRYALSRRECEVLDYLARGYSQVYIAKELYISENTARTHVKHIYAKANIHSREELLELLNPDA